MTRSCPHPDCEHESESGRGIAVHWGRSEKHDGSLSENYPDYDTSSTERHSKATSEGLMGNTLTEEHKENIAEARRGVSHHTKEGKEKMSEFMKGNDYAVGYELTEAQKEALQKGRDMPAPDTQKEKVSEIMKGNSHGRRNTCYVYELDHDVDSNWEIDIAFLLKSLNVDYEREPEYEIWDGRSYFPDFQVDDVVIEVKGYADDYSHKKAEYFADNYPEKTYVVVGTEMACDVHIAWENRQDLKEIIALNSTFGRDMRPMLVRA